MAKMPISAKPLAGFGKYGIDNNGENVFFTLVVSAKQHATYFASHKDLAGTIHYLQQIARGAEERRLAKSRQKNPVQMLETPPNVIHKGSIMPDTTGQLARLDGTTASGVPIELQIEFQALVGLHERLPGLIEKMLQLQDQRK